MTSIERTAYPRFKRYYTLNELKQIYTPTQDEIKFAYEHTKGENNFLNIIVLLKSFQRLGYFPDLNKIPLQIINHLKKELSIPDNINCHYSHKRTLYRHRQLIREYINVVPFNQQGIEKLTKIVTKSAYSMDNPADLINVAIEELVKERSELPGFNTLDRLVANIRTKVNQNLFEQVINQLSPENIAEFNLILTADSHSKLTAFNQIKQLPKSPTRNHLNELLIHLQWLTLLGDVSPYLKHITSAKIKHFAAQAKAFDASYLKEMNLPKRITLILCLIYDNQVNTRDNLVSMFLKRMAKIHFLGQEKLEQQRQKQQETVEKLVSVFTDVLQVFADESTSQNVEEEVKDIFIPNGGVEQLLNECEAVNAYKGNNYFPLLWQFYKSHRSAFFRLINALDLQSTTTDYRLINAVKFLLANAHRKGEWLKGEIDLSFASVQWQNLILKKKGKQTKIVRRHFEVCVFSYLAAELKSGDVSVEGSSEYADWRTQLLSWDECQKILPKYCEDLDLPKDADSLVASLKSWLTETAEKVDSSYPQNEQLIINEDGEPILKKLPKNQNNPTLKNLEAIIAERMPNRNLIDILRNVDYWTNFTRHFGPISGSDPKIENPTERYLLTTFTYGCNLGPVQAAKHMRGVVSSKLLSFINRRHLSIDKLNKAMTDIINRYHVLDLPKVWGKGNSAAADGTKYDVREQNLLSEYHIRYGGYGGIAYHHVADKYIALFSHFIPCGTWEAVYIIEGLLENKSDLKPETIHGDTQGQSTPVFALSHLLGIKLMPRIRNWKDLVFYRPDKDVVYQHIDSLFTDTINWELIRTHWQDLMQVVLSIHTGKISSAVLLRKLGNYSRKNRLYKAFRELGRVIRTIFLLEYISQPKLRRKITAMTNKVEAYQGFAKWFFFGGDSIITTNDREEMEKRIKYNDLVANAVIFHNVVDLTNILQQLKREGYLLDKDDVAALSPYLTSQIKRFGDYLVDFSQIPPSLDENMLLSL